MLSTILSQQTNGLRLAKQRIPNEPAHPSRQAMYNYIYSPDGDRIDEYNSREENPDVQEDAFDDEEKESRRLFEWFSRLFQSTTPRVVPTTPTTTESNYEKELKERIFLRALHRNLTELLLRLSHVERRVSVAMAQKEAYAIITKGKPQVLGLDDTYYYHNRVKRNVSNVIEAETVLVTEAQVTQSNIRTNGTADDGANVTATDHPCGDNITNARRVGSGTPAQLTNKLLLYLQESFLEINSKISSLRNLKQLFSDNISFRVGYILANIDTLEISMAKLKRDLVQNKELWEDSKILELYDTLKASNQAVSGLIESLKLYLERLADRPQTKLGMNFR